MHADLLFVNYFPSFLSYHGVWDIYGYFGDHFLKYNFTYYPPLVYYLTALAQWLVKAVNPGFDVLMSHVHGVIYFEKGISSPAHDYLAPFSIFQRLQFVFWMKSPYLVADGFCLWVISKLSLQTASGSGDFLLKSWLFDPVLLFSIYIFGQYRIYSALFIWLVIYFLEKRKIALASFIVGVMCLADNFPFALLLPAVLIFGKSWKERAVFFLTALSPVIFLLTPLVVSSKGYVFYSYASPLIQKLASQGILRHYPEVIGPICKGIFLSTFLFTLFCLCRKKNNNPTATKQLFIYVSLALLFVIYATSTTSVHYFMWALPFFSILRCEGEPWPRVYSGALVALLFLFNLDSRALNLGLFMPLDPGYFMSLPSLHEIAARYGPWGGFIGLCRLGFSFICLYFAIEIYRKRIRPLLRF